jgi:hypothetical protein
MWYALSLKPGTECGKIDIPEKCPELRFQGRKLPVSRKLSVMEEQRQGKAVCFEEEITEENDNCYRSGSRWTWCL